MTYKISIRRKAQKQLARIPAIDFKKVKAAIQALANNPKPSGSKKLKGPPEWRIRQDAYRVIYEIQDDQLIMVVLDIGDRKDIYR